MNQQPSTQFKPVYYLQRPQSPKNTMSTINNKNLSLTMSIGANQSANNFLPMQKIKTQQLSHMSSEATLPQMDKYERLQQQMKNLSKQNNILKEQNDQLKRQLMKNRKQPNADNVRSMEKYSSVSPDAYNDLRGTIKKEMGQMKEMRLKMEMLSKQCKMYEEIIEKMEERIKKLNHELVKKNGEIDEARAEITKVEQLKDKTNSLMRAYSDIQSKFNMEQLQWMKWKQGWLSEKQYYLQRIRQLQRYAQKSYH